MYTCGVTKICCVHVDEQKYIYIYTYIHLPRTQMTHSLKDLTHKMEGIDYIDG